MNIFIDRKRLLHFSRIFIKFTCQKFTQLEYGGDTSKELDVIRLRHNESNIEITFNDHPKNVFDPFWLPGPEN